MRRKGRKWLKSIEMEVEEENRLEMDQKSILYDLQCVCKMECWSWSLGLHWATTIRSIVRVKALGRVKGQLSSIDETLNYVLARDDGNLHLLSSGDQLFSTRGVTDYNVYHFSWRKINENPIRITTKGKKPHHTYEISFCTYSHPVWQWPTGQPWGQATTTAPSWPPSASQSKTSFHEREWHFFSKYFCVVKNNKVFKIVKNKFCLPVRRERMCNYAKTGR